MLIHPNVQLEIARQRHAELLADAERHRIESASRQLRPRPFSYPALERGRELLCRLRRVNGRDAAAPRPELAESILIRHSRDGDRAALEHLAALDSRTLAEGAFLLAEVDGELVAAAPLDSEATSLSDPFRRSADIRELLELRARLIRRSRVAVGGRHRSRRAVVDGAWEVRHDGAHGTN